MLETIREYARERLDEKGETDALARRHADYTSRCSRIDNLSSWAPAARSCWRGSGGGGQPAGNLDYLEATPPDAARAADLLTWFWVPRGRAVEAQERVLRLLARTDFAAGTRAMLLADASEFELRLGQLDGAESHAQEAVTLARESGERGTLAYALWIIAGVATHRGDFDEAIRLLTRMLEEAADDEWLRSGALRDLASAQMEAGRDDEARRLFQEASSRFHAMEDDANESIARMCLAYLELYVRDFEAAYVVAASALEQVRAIGDLYRTIGALMVLGFAALGLGRRSEARETFTASLDLVLSADTRYDALPDALTGIALAADTADARTAARLRGAVNKLFEPARRLPAIPPARAISRTAAHRRPRRGRIRGRAGTRRRHGCRRGDRPGANAHQPGEPTSGRRVLKERLGFVGRDSLSLSGPSRPQEIRL